MSEPSLTNAASLVPVGAFAGKPAMPLTRPVIVVGSGKNSRILLKSDTVSTTHSLLVHTSTGWYVRDLASRTHTILNGKPVREAPLRNGDTLTIGAFVFQFVTVNASASTEPQAATPAAFEITGAELPVPMDARTMLIGRRPGCEVRLIEESVSLIQSVVFEIDGTHYVRDLYSRNGTRLNGQKVHQAELKFGDVIRVGDTYMKYVPDEALIEQDQATQPTIDLADVAPSGGALVGDDAASPIFKHEDEGSVVPLGRPQRPATPPAPAEPLPLEPVAELPQPKIAPPVAVPATPAAAIEDEELAIQANRPVSLPPSPIPPQPIVADANAGVLDDPEADVLGLLPPASTTYTDLPDLVPVPTVTSIPPVMPLAAPIVEQSLPTPAVEPLVLESVSHDVGELEGLTFKPHVAETLELEPVIEPQPAEAPLVAAAAAPVEEPIKVAPEPEPVALESTAAETVAEAPAVAPAVVEPAEPVEVESAEAEPVGTAPVDDVAAIDPLTTHVPLAAHVIEPSAAVEPAAPEHHESEAPLAVPSVEDLLPASPEAVELAELQAQIRAALADPSVLLDRPLLPPDQPLVAAEDALMSKAARRARMIAEMLETNEEIEEEAEREAKSIEFPSVPEDAVPPPPPIVEPEPTPIVELIGEAPAGEPAPTVAAPVDEAAAEELAVEEPAEEAATQEPLVTPDMPIAAAAVSDDAEAIAATVDADATPTTAIPAVDELTPPTPQAAPPVVVEVATADAFNPADSLETAPALDAVDDEPNADEIRARLAALEEPATATSGDVTFSVVAPIAGEAIAEEEVDAAAAKLAAADEAETLDESLLASDAPAVAFETSDSTEAQDTIEPTLSARDEVIELPVEPLAAQPVLEDEPAVAAEPIASADADAAVQTPSLEAVAEAVEPPLTVEVHEATAEVAETIIESAIEPPARTLEAIAEAPPAEVDVLPIEPLPGPAAITSEPTEESIQLDEERAPVEVDQYNAGDVIETTPHDAGVAEQSAASWAEIAAAETGHGPHAVDAASRLEDGTPLDTAEIDRPGNVGAVDPEQAIVAEPATPLEEPSVEPTPRTRGRRSRNAPTPAAEAPQAEEAAPKRRGGRKPPERPSAKTTGKKPRRMSPEERAAADAAVTGASIAAAAAEATHVPFDAAAVEAAEVIARSIETPEAPIAETPVAEAPVIEEPIAPTTEDVALSAIAEPVSEVEEPQAAELPADEAAAIEAEFAAGESLPAEPTEALAVNDVVGVGDLESLPATPIDNEATDLLAEQASEPAPVELESLGTPTIDEVAQPIDQVSPIEPIAAIDPSEEVAELATVEPVGFAGGEAIAAESAIAPEPLAEETSTTPSEPIGSLPVAATGFAADEAVTLDVSPAPELVSAEIEGASVVAEEPIEAVASTEEVVTPFVDEEATVEEVATIKLPVSQDDQTLLESTSSVSDTEGTIAAAAEAASAEIDEVPTLRITDTAGLAPVDEAIDDQPQNWKLPLPSKPVAFVSDADQAPQPAKDVVTTGTAKPSGVINVELPDIDELEQHFQDAFAEALAMAEGVTFAGGAKPTSTTTPTPPPAPVKPPQPANEWKLDESLLEALEAPRPTASPKPAPAQSDPRFQLDESLLNAALEAAQRPQPTLPPAPAAAPTKPASKWELDTSLLDQIGGVDPVRAVLPPIAPARPIGGTSATPDMLSLGGVGWAGNAPTGANELEDLPESWQIPQAPGSRPRPKAFTRRPTRRRRPVPGQTPDETETSTEPAALDSAAVEPAPAAVAPTLPATPAPHAASLTTRVESVDELEALETPTADVEETTQALATASEESSADVMDAALDAVAEAEPADAFAEPAPLDALTEVGESDEPVSGTLDAGDVFSEDESSADAITALAQTPIEPEGAAPAADGQAPAAETPSVLPPRPRRGGRNRGEAAVDQSFDPDEAAAASPFAAQALPLVDAFSQAPTADELAEVLNRIGGEKIRGGGQVDDHPPITQDRPVAPARSDAAELDEVLGELPVATPFASHVPIDVGPNRPNNRAPGVRRARQVKNTLPITLLLMFILMGATGFGIWNYWPVPATVRGSLSFDNLGRIRTDDREQIQRDILAGFTGDDVRATARHDLDDRYGNGFLDHSDELRTMANAAHFDDVGDGVVSFVVDRKTRKDEAEQDRVRLDRLLARVQDAVGKPMIERRNKVVQEIAQIETSQREDQTTKARLDTEKQRLAAIFDARPDGSTLQAATDKLAELEAARQAAVRALDERTAELQRLESNQTLLFPANRSHSIDGYEIQSDDAYAFWDADLNAARRLPQGVMMVDASDDDAGIVRRAMADDASTTQPSTQPVAAATQPADLASQVNAARERVETLTIQRDRLKESLDRLLAAQSPESRAARENFDKSLEAFAGDVEQARRALGDSPEVQRYIEAARQLQDQIRQKTDQLVRRQQNYLTRMMEFRSRLLALTDSTRDQRYRSDEALQQHVNELQIEERRLNAARASNVDAVEVAEIERRVELLRSMIDARKQLLDDPKASTVTRELEDMIATAQREMAQDRAENDRMLADIQQSFRQGQLAQLGQLPADQKRAAEQLAARLAAIDLARQRYTNALSVAAGGDEASINDQRNQLASLETQLTQERDNLTQLQSRAADDERQRNAMIAAQAEEMERRAKAAQQLDTARTAVVAARTAREQADVAYADQQKVVDELTTRKQAADRADEALQPIINQLSQLTSRAEQQRAQLSERRTMLAFAVVPSTVEPRTVTILDADKFDPRYVYTPLGVALMALPFVGLIFWDNFGRKGARRESAPSGFDHLTPNDLPRHARPA